MFLRGHVTNLEQLYLHYHYAYGHKTYQGGDIRQRAPIHKFTWSLNEVVMWGHIYIISQYAEDPRTSN